MALASDGTADVPIPKGYVDYIVRYIRDGNTMRSQVYRVQSEADATQRANAAVSDGAWAGWQIVDISTVPEAKARLRGDNE
ncbi:hypothetical protein [Xanthomonas phage XPV1]|uniref:Uncharacterized protein n=1 Tax=Xanthomonas phage XPV1 TaxID=2099860 RepID=A0A3S7I6B7_9CAUD|nr:hypothetical protein KEM12_gp31 [Xanthomonas phage XPV1]AVO24195.1 hypothetical protein [Xanthomonas phage XPV1]